MERFDIAAQAVCRTEAVALFGSGAGAQKRIERYIADQWRERKRVVVGEYNRFVKRQEDA